MEENKSTNIFEGLSYQVLPTKILSNAIKKDHIAPAYLFTGPKGVGQKEIAISFFERIVKETSKSSRIRDRLLSGNHPDFSIIEPTYIHQGALISKSKAKEENMVFKVMPQIRLEQTQSLIRFLSKKSMEAKMKMVLIEDAETLNEAAGNSLLKTIEEPINCVLILTTSRPDKILTTIRSRCQQIPFRGLNNSILQEKINQFKENNIVSNEIGNDEILSLAQGSSTLLQENLERLITIPNKIISQLKVIPNNALSCLLLAKEVTEELSLEQQLWLIGWLKIFYWSQKFNSSMIKRLNKLEFQLKSHVNHRIAWEIALIELTEISAN